MWPYECIDSNLNPWSMQWENLVEDNSVALFGYTCPLWAKSYCKSTPRCCTEQSPLSYDQIFLFQWEWSCSGWLYPHSSDPGTPRMAMNQILGSSQTKESFLEGWHCIHRWNLNSPSWIWWEIAEATEPCDQMRERTQREKRAELNYDLPGCESPMRKPRASIRFQLMLKTFVAWVK